MPFAQLGLHDDVVKGVKAMGFTQPTPIQAQAIPMALEGSDLLGCAQTGSGKTAAFSLPILHKLLKTPKPGLRALILVPTRELAAQVETMFRDCGRFTPIRVALAIGGAGFHAQKLALSQGAQVLIATPGRMLDHIRQGTVKLERIEFLVLDEADRMLDMGFLPQIRQIITRLPKQRQTMLFSATLVPEVQRIASFALRDPKRVDISRPTSVADGIAQVIYPVSVAQKSDLLIALFEATKIRSGVVFCRTKHGADRLAKRLKERGFSVGVLHANRTQGQRTQAMESFREGTTQILVATDIAARGIDVPEITHVINYDVPLHAEDYVHRVGRTGRASAAGDAVTLMTPDEASSMTAIEKFCNVTFPRAVLPNFPYTVQPSLVAPKPKTFRDMNWGRFKRRFR